MNELVIKNENYIDNMIYEIRGKQVMLGSDLAKIFHKETRVINQTIKRNIDKFSTDICFQLTLDEFLNLRSQIVTSKEEKNKFSHGGNRYLPYVFTEQGVDILALTLKISLENEENIKIIKNSFLKRRTTNYEMLSTFENKGKISDMIYEIRGKQVMLDTDLARLYQCKNGAKTINLAVRRHINRFPKRFMFRLTWEEAKRICPRFQVETLNDKNDRGQNIKYLPYAFTEQGVAMLATVLRTPVAEQISIQIMDAFVLMRKYIPNHFLEQRYINNMVLSHDEDLKLIHSTLEQLEHKELTNEIYFDGQIYDAYSKIIDIMNMANNELIIIDCYADKSVLDMISKIDKDVILIIKEKGLLNRIDLEKYHRQYHNLSVIYNNTFHDRFIILDKKEIYHLGASINYAGSKTFCVNKIEEKVITDSFIKHVTKVIELA